MGSKFTAIVFILLIFMLMLLPSMYACAPCKQPHPPPYHHPNHPKVPHPNPPTTKHPPHRKGSPKVKPPLPPVVIVPPITNPPVITPPITNPPVTIPTPPSTGGGSGSGGNPVENACCPILGGLLELEAAVCLCTAIRLKLLNINIFIPLALQALITCGKSPPTGFVCPPL
ncbi:hypothetical protein V6N13_027939 [Hibiscus sabdariffa]